MRKLDIRNKPLVIDGRRGWCTWFRFLLGINDFLKHNGPFLFRIFSIFVSSFQYLFHLFYIFVLLIAFVSSRDNQCTKVGNSGGVEFDQCEIALDSAGWVQQNSRQPQDRVPDHILITGITMPHKYYKLFLRCPENQRHADISLPNALKIKIKISKSPLTRLEIKLIKRFFEIAPNISSKTSNLSLQTSSNVTSAMVFKS